MASLLVYMTGVLLWSVSCMWSYLAVKRKRKAWGIVAGLFWVAFIAFLVT